MHAAFRAQVLQKLEHHEELRRRRREAVAAARRTFDRAMREENAEQNVVRDVIIDKYPINASLQTANFAIEIRKSFINTRTGKLP